MRGGEFQTVGCEHSAAGEYSFYALYIAGEVGMVEAHIYGGTYTSASQFAVLCGNDNTGGDGGINAKATAYIHGGTFNGGGADGQALMAGKNTGDPQITGGTFSSDVSTYVPSGLTIQKNDDGSFSVWALDPPVVNVKAENTTIHEGKNVILTAEVSYGVDTVSFAYSWYKDGVLLKNETESTLTVTEGGSYTVKVSAFDGTLKSEEAESAPVVCTVEGHAFGLSLIHI